MFASRAASADGGTWALREHLVAQQVTCVVMEATGDYWKPFYYLLEDLPGVEVMLVNARHVKSVPGRKTDVADATWLAQLGAHGLVKASFVPPEPIRQLRDLTRARTAIIRERAREAQRLEKLLEDSGITLSAVASDILGVSGRLMLDALIAGGRDPAVLADLAQRHGSLEYGVALRRVLAEVIRRHRPEVVITGNFRDTWGGTSLNQADHIAVGRAALDAARDAGNRWIFPEQLSSTLKPWGGVKAVWAAGSPESRHAVDTTDTFDLGVTSLEAHRAYIDGLGWENWDPREFLEGMVRQVGQSLGVAFAAPFEVYSLGWGD